MDFRAELAVLLKQAGVQEAATLLEVPPDPDLGDYALPCFSLAKEWQKSPQEIAAEIAGKITADFLREVQTAGPYVNFFIKQELLTQQTLHAIKEDKLWQPAGNKKILMEYPSPNTNKPLHLGHVRNMVLGSAIASLLKKYGHTVIQVNLNNDRGIHICKSMLAYQKFGDNAEPDKKSDHYVGDWYVKFAEEAAKNPSLEEEAQEMLRKWEDNDPDVRAVWEKMNSWAFAGFRQTYQNYHVSFDKEYYESQFYQEGKKIVEEHKDKFIQDEKGNIVAPLEQFGVQDKIVLRADGTSIYMTQDLALTTKKIEEFHPDLQVWIVASEQNLHFKQLFAILKLIGVDEGEQFLHYSYGMVRLPDGRMKSREGKVIDADDLLEEMEELAAKEIGLRRKEWPPEKIQEKAKTVALGAIRFFILKYDPAKDFTFDPETSLSFEGDTGPYLQYTHARICSILRQTALPERADLSVLKSPEEIALVRELRKLGEAFTTAGEQIKPSTLAMQLLELGRAFNTFYHACPVLKAAEQEQAARLELLDAVRKALSEGLTLLGIEAPNEM